MLEELYLDEMILGKNILVHIWILKEKLIHICLPISGVYYEEYYKKLILNFLMKQ
jgi:hypothetical protein